MNKKIPNVQRKNKSLSVTNGKEYKDSVRLIEIDKREDHPVFLFNDFKMNSICIPGEFNNHYKDADSYMRIISTLFGKGLSLLSNESVKELIENPSKQAALHFHKIAGKDDILQKILREYKFTEDKITQILEGNMIYQFEVPFENGASRVVLQIIDNAFSLLFLDVNHHIYFNENKVKQSNSLFYEECPVNTTGECYRMKYLDTCFAFEFLDEEKIRQTYGYSFDYDE